jgi:probable HAF family extracellular repeat protein
MFMGFGDLAPGGSYYAGPVSADGSTVVGRIVYPLVGGASFLWTVEGGFVGLLGDLPGGHFSTRARAVSADGSVVVGEASSSASTAYLEPFRWTADGGMVSLGDFAGGRFKGFARGVSADGSVVVGASEGASGQEAFRWTSDSGMVGLGDLPGGPFFSYASGISADGSLIVGSSKSATGMEAYRWTADSGMVGLGFRSAALAVSSDGSTVVVVVAEQPYLWTADGGMVSLGSLPGAIDSQPLAISGDGSVVVGYSVSDLYEEEAFVWDADHGMRVLQDVLANDYGLDLTGWSLKGASGISDDGLTIVGMGVSPSGKREAWIAVIPEPTTAVEIDIKPGSDPNPINPFSRGVIPVAILTTEDFDALTVDEDSVRFGPAEAEKRHKQAHVEDVDGDGDLDLLLHFSTQETGIALGDTEACLTGQTYDGVPIMGCDSVRTVPPGGSAVSTTVSSAVSSTNCGLGAELALLLPPLMWLWRRRSRY